MICRYGFFGKIFSFFIVIILVSGCGRRYLADREDRLLGQKVVSEWRGLDGGVLQEGDQIFSLNIKIKDFVSSKYLFARKDVYKSGVVVEDGSVKGNRFGGCVGIGMGCLVVGGGLFLVYGNWYRSQSSSYSFNSEMPPPTCFFVSALSLGIIGLAFAGGDIPPQFVSLSEFFKVDTVCVDSYSLNKEKIIIEAKDVNFKEVYYTDEVGKVELKISEIIQEPSRADSVLKLKLYYREMIDSVDVKIR